MTGTTTPRTGLYKPDTLDLVNVITDLNNNMDKLDANASFLVCTSSTRPSTPFPGQCIFEGDTHRFYVWTSATWTELAAPGASQTFPAGSSVTILGAAATNVVEALAVTGDANRRLGLRADGRLSWGPGGGTAEDTFLYRNSAGELKTDGKLTIAGDLSVGGIGSRTVLRKAADTARTTATKSDDPDLTLTITAGQVYELEGLLLVNTTDESGADFSSTLTVPASCAGYVNYVGQDTPIASPAGTPLMVASSLGSPGTQTFGAVTTAHYSAGSSITMSGLVRPTVTGTFALNWARSGGSGTVTLKTDSFIRLTRVA